MVQRPVDLPGPVASGPNTPPFPGCPWSAESCASHDLKKVTPGELWFFGSSGFQEFSEATGVHLNHPFFGLSIINQPAIKGPINWKPPHGHLNGNIIGELFRPCLIARGNICDISINFNAKTSRSDKVGFLMLDVEYKFIGFN